MSNPNETFKQAAAVKPVLKATTTKPLLKATIGTIRSSNGVVMIDLSTGKVVKVYGDSDWKKHVDTIDHYDLAEYREFYHDIEGNDTSFDILDIGYWTMHGKYVPASKQYRADIAEDIE